MATRTNNPAPHAGEKEARPIPKDGETPGMGAPPHADRDDDERPQADPEIPALGEREKRRGPTPRR